MIFINYFVLKIDLEENFKSDYLMSLFEKVSVKHCELLKLSYFDLIEKNRSWVITKSKYQLNKKWKKGTYYIKTWPLDRKHYEYQREYVIYDEFNEVYLIASTIWALIDKTTRKILNEDVYLFECLNKKNFQDRLKILRSFTKEEGNYLGCYEIDNQCIDINNHVNNSIYPRIIQMFIKNKFITKFEINYLKELILEDKVFLYQKDDLVEGFKNDLELSFICKLD